MTQENAKLEDSYCLFTGTITDLKDFGFKFFYTKDQRVCAAYRNEEDLDTAVYLSLDGPEFGIPERVISWNFNEKKGSVLLAVQDLLAHDLIVITTP